MKRYSLRLILTAVLLCACASVSNGAPVAKDPAYQRANEARIELATTDGVQLVATYFASTDARVEFASAVVLLHDVGETRFNLLEWARLLNRKGVAVVAPDLRGFGESTVTSEGKTAYRLKADDPAFFAGMTADVEACRRFLSQQPNVNMKAFSVMGGGLGANLALVYAAAEPSVRSVVLLSPRLEIHGLKALPALKGMGDRPVQIMVQEGPEAEAIKPLIEALARNPRSELISRPAMGSGSAISKDFRQFDDWLIGFTFRSFQPGKSKD